MPEAKLKTTVCYYCWIERLCLGNRDVIVLKEGTGRLYYRLNMLFAPSSLSVESYNNGFEVNRRYEAVNTEDSSNVTKDDKVWKIKKGTLVKVTLTLVSLYFN